MKIKMQFTKTIALLVSLVLIFSSCIKRPTQNANKPTEKIELNFWNLYDASDVLKGQIEEFESLNKGVSINYKKFSNLEEYEDLLINEMAEGQGPDIFAIKNSWVNKHQGKISPLENDSEYHPQSFQDVFFQVASQDLIRDNKIYALPHYIDSLAIYYNQQLLADNITDSDKPSNTWEGIKSQASKISKADNSIERFLVSAIAMGRTDNILRGKDVFYNLLLQSEAEIDDGKTSKIASSKGVNPLTKKSFFPLKDSLELFSSFANSQYQNYSWNSSMTAFAKEEMEINPFLRGKTAMIFGYSYLYEDLINMHKKLSQKRESLISVEDIKVAEIPQLEDFSQTGKRDALALYFPLTVSKNSANQKMAWEFIKFLVSAKSQSDYHEKTHKPSSRKDLINEQALEPIYGTFALQASYAKSLETSLAEGFIDQVFHQAILDSHSNKLSLQSIANNVQKQISCQLKKKAKGFTGEEDCLEDF